MARRVGISGSPGTGKKSVSSLVSSRLSCALLDLNAIALGGFPQSQENGVVDPRVLRRRLSPLMLQDCVVSGHLLPYVCKSTDLDFVAVLRCEPSVLRSRLRARRYEEPKVIENVEAELIGVVLAECVQVFGSSVVREYDSTGSSPSRLASRIVTDLLTGKHHKKRWIDWTLRYDSASKLSSLLSLGRTESAST